MDEISMDLTSVAPLRIFNGINEHLGPVVAHPLYLNTEPQASLMGSTHVVVGLFENLL